MQQICEHSAFVKNSHRRRPYCTYCDTLDRQERRYWLLVARVMENESDQAALSELKKYFWNEP